VSSRLGSALRLSQPLSGFLASHELRSPVSYYNRSWDPPSELSPRRERAPLSRPLLPCSHPPTCRDAPPVALSPPVSPTSTPSRGCLVPPTTMGSLSANRNASFPFALDHLQRSRLFPPASPASKSCSPCESVRTGLGCPAPAAVALLGFRPSRVFALRASDPQTRPDNECPNTPLPRRIGFATPGTSRPPAPGEASPALACRVALVGSLRSPSEPARTACRRRSYSLDLGHPGQARCSLALGALKYVKSGVSPRRPPTLLGSPTSSTTS
jgi:hypothetical protein